MLVQLSVYGTDNSVLLDALRVQPGRQCGVVVIDASITEQSWLACTAWACSSGIEGGTEN